LRKSGAFEMAGETDALYALEAAGYLFGGISLGYLLLRLTYPDIRLIEKYRALGMSFVLGALVVAAAWGTSLLGSWAFTMQGLLPLFVMAYALFGYSVMKLYFFFNSPALLTVGIPLHEAALAQKAFGSPEGPQEISAPAAGGFGEPKKTGGGFEGGETTWHAVAGKPAATPSRHEVGEMQVESEAQEIIGEKREEPEPEPASPMTAGAKAGEKPLLPAVSPPERIAPQKPAEIEKPAGLGEPEKGGWLDGALSAFFGMFPQKKKETETAFKTAQTRQAGKNESEAQKMKATLLPPKPAAPEYSAPPWVMRLQKKGQAAGLQAQEEKPKEAGIVKEQERKGELLKSPKPASEKNEAGETAITKIPVSGEPEKIIGPAQIGAAQTVGWQDRIIVPQKTDKAKTPLEGIVCGFEKPKIKAEAVPDRERESKLVEEARKMYVGQEKMDLVEISIPLKPPITGLKWPGAMLTAQGSAEEEKETIAQAKKTAKETISREKREEVEKEIEDILPALERQEKREKKAAQARGQEQAPGRGEQVRHRLYAQPDAIKVVASKEVLNADEFGAIITDVYSQLKDAAKEETLGQSMTSVNAPPKVKSFMLEAPGGAGGEKAKSLEAELFGQPAAQTGLGKGREGGGLFDQLSRINAAAGVPEGAKAGGVQPSTQMEFVHIQGGKGLGCPNCHQKNAKIVFCPYCGSGMCANCSPNVRLEMDGFGYTCPKCAEEVHIKKKKPVPAYA
jgi:DNA-directed RNA polymerase subunit RPC12/RpoP